MRKEPTTTLFNILLILIRVFVFLPLAGIYKPLILGQSAAGHRVVISVVGWTRCHDLQFAHIFRQFSLHPKIPLAETHFLFSLCVCLVGQCSLLPVAVKKLTKTTTTTIYNNWRNNITIILQVSVGVLILWHLQKDLR